MILLYTALLLLLGTIKFLVGLRARALERKYMRLAGAVEHLVRQADCRPGNNSKHDPCQNAKRAFLLGQLVQQRDRAEARQYAWQHGVDRVNSWIRALGEWKGKKLPYTLGVVDVGMLLYAIDYLGVGQHVSAGNALQSIAALFTP